MIVCSEILKAKFKVQFINETVVDRKGRSSLITHCKLFVLYDHSLGQEWKEIAHCISKQNVMDRCDRTTGKVLAFGRAMEDGFRYVEIPDTWIKNHYDSIKAKLLKRQARKEEFWPVFEKNFGAPNPRYRK